MASRVGARDPAMINEQALKIQGWWRRILARKELIRRWTLAQKLDLKEEYDWQYAAGGKRIDVFGAQGLSNLENYEIMGRNGLMQEERMQWLELTRYLKYTQEQMMQAYPNVVFSQHEYVMRLQVMQEHSAELAAMVDHEETLMRSRLRNEEATLRIRIAHLTKTIWRQRQMKALNDEIRRRATLTREEDAAWKMKLGTHRRIVCGLEQLKALQALEEEEAQQRSEPTMEEALAWQAMQSAAKASVEEALQKTKEREANVHVEEQQEFVTGEEAARAEIIVEVLQQFVASTEMLEDAWRTEGVAAEQRTWEIHLALGALQIEELKERSEIAELWDSVLASDRSAKEQDLARIEFQRDGVFAEAKARVKIVLEEIDGWYLCLTEELKHREEVMRQQQTAEETEGYQGMVMELQCCQEEETKLQQVLGLNTEEEEERQQHEQAQQQQRDALYQSFDFLCGDTLFRERWRAQETLERDMLAAMIMREELEHDEAAERKLILAEEMRMQHFLQECTMARWEHIVRESIVGEEIEIRRLIQARDTKELAAARKAYLQAVQTRQEEEQSIFIIEESAMRQKIHNEQLQERRAIGTEAAEDRQRVIEAEVAADQAAAETADKHVRDRADLELDEMEGRQELEKSEIVDFIFLVGVRKLTKLERSTRRLIVEEQERKQMAIGNRAMLYHIEAAELAERAHFEGVDEGDRVGMAELYSKSRVQAEYAMLMRNVRLTQEEELADVEQFEAAFRQRVELQQADQRGDIALLAVESHEQIQRTTVEVLQVRGWAQKLAMDERQRGELEAAQEVTQRHKATMKFHKAMDHTKRERQLQEENEAQEERANLIQEETAERASLVKYESRLFDEIPFDACQEQEMLHRRSLLHTRQRWYQEFTQRLSCHKKFVDGLIDLDAEQTLAWQMLMCEWEETEARFELEVDDFMVRTGLFELLVIGIEEDAQRSRIRRSEDQRSQAMMKKMVVEAQMESRADLERTALRVRGHVAGYEAEEWQQDIVIAHLTGLLELQEPELRRRIGQREREAFLTYGFPWVELQESAARQALDSTCIGAIKALNADVRTAAAEQTLWMALRELQVDEAQLRRQTMHLEDEKRLVLQAERKADAEAIDEQLRRAQLLRKEHAMERLHLTLIERDARHSIQHNEDRSWQQVSHGPRDGGSCVWVCAWPDWRREANQERGASVHGSAPSYPCVNPS
uniref:Uncharacterized protein n=1 Tax=Eutreptiella gymnastica TaxID=73025 RepID=A0A7S4LFM2_9EUGL